MDEEFFCVWLSWKIDCLFAVFLSGSVSTLSKMFLSQHCEGVTTPPLYFPIRLGCRSVPLSKVFIDRLSVNSLENSPWFQEALCVFLAAVFF